VHVRQRGRMSCEAVGCGLPRSRRPRRPWRHSPSTRFAKLTPTSSCSSRWWPSRPTRFQASLVASSISPSVWAGWTTS
jgi:hypothetical protein